jgi:hypothetical protein
VNPAPRNGNCADRILNCSYIFISLLSKEKVAFNREMLTFSTPFMQVLEWFLFAFILFHSLNGIRIILVARQKVLDSASNYEFFRWITDISYKCCFKSLFADTLQPSIGTFLRGCSAQDANFVVWGSGSNFYGYCNVSWTKWYIWNY